MGQLVKETGPGLNPIRCCLTVALFFSSPLFSHRSRASTLTVTAIIDLLLTSSSSPAASISNMSDEEPVDARKDLETLCKAKCVREWRAYEDCVTRIKDDDTGAKHCTGQSFDYIRCLDICVAPKLFAKLK